MTLPPFVIDCDTGRDDALAIWIALNAGLPLRGVLSSYGNTPLRNVAGNNARVIGLAGKDVPQYRGMDRPPTDHKGYRDIVLPRQQKSGNGLCNIELPPAAEKAGDMAAFAKTLNEKTDYVITGPATNFAALLEQGIKTGTVTMMGGKFEPLWTQVPGADFNLACDPAAIQAIFDHGIKIRFVPMNATWPMALTLEQVEALKPKTQIAEAAKTIMVAHCKYFAPEPVFRFHDPTVIMACLRPDRCFEDERLRIVLDEESPDYGRLVLDAKGFGAAIYRPTDEDRKNILKEMLDALGF